MYPTSQPTRLPSGQPTSHPSGLPTGQPTSQPSQQPSSSPSQQPIGAPSSQPSSAPTGAPTFATRAGVPKIVTMTKKVYNTSMVLDVTLSADAYVYAAVYETANLKINQVTAAGVKGFNQGGSTEQLRRTLSISSLFPSTQYTLFYYVEGTNGIGMSDKDVRQLGMNISTECCRVINVQMTRSSIWATLSELNWLTISADTAPTSQLQLNFTIESRNSSSTLSIDQLIVPSAVRFAAFTSVATTTSKYYISLSNTIVSGHYYLRVVVTGKDSSKYRVHFGGNPSESAEFDVVSFGSPLPAPELLNAEFSEDGTSIVAQYDGNTDQGTLSGRFSCDQLFNFTCSERSTCYWNSQQQVTINVANSDECIAPNEVLFVAADIAIRASCPLGSSSDCSSHDNWPTSLSKSIVVKRSSNPSTPVVSLPLPAQVGNCSSLVLDVGSSRGSAGRSWTSYSMSVTSSTANTSSITEFLKRSFAPTAPLFISPLFLVAGSSYTFTVTLCNFMGICGEISKIVSVRESNIPSFLIAGSPVRQMTVSQELKLATTLQISRCGDAGRSSVQYRWSVWGANGAKLDVPNQSRNPSSLTIPAYTLTSQSYYTVFAAIENPAWSLNTSVRVEVYQGAVIACIGGNADLGVRIGSSLALDARCSYDEEVRPTSSLKNLNFEWTCRMLVPTIMDGCDGVVDDAALIANKSSGYLLLPVLAEAAVGSKVQFSVLVSSTTGSQRSSTASVVVSILSSLAVTADILNSKGRVVMNPTSKLSLSANLQVPANVSVSAVWLAYPPVDFATNALTSSSAQYALLPYSSSPKIYLALSPNTLQIGVSYTFSLICNSQSAWGERASALASLSVVVNEAPRPGKFHLEPMEGYAFEDTFIFTSYGWTDTDLPISYTYGRVNALGTQIVIRFASQISLAMAQLPPGASGDADLLRCFVNVSDTFEAATQAIQSVVVHPPASNATSSTISALLDVGASSLDNVMIDDVMQSVMGATALLNSVNCSLAPNCTALNRVSCYRTPHTCGPCLTSSPIGVSGDSNSPCFDQIATPERDESSAQRQCPGNCSGHGRCHFISVISSREVSTCSVDQFDCYAACECDDDYALSASSCLATNAEVLTRRAQRQVAVSMLTAMYESQDVTAGAVDATLAAVLDVSQSSDELNAVTAVNLITLLSGATNDSVQRGFDINSLSLLPASLNSVLSASSLLPSLGTGSSDSANIATETLQCFASQVEDDLVPGERAYQLYYEHFQLLVVAVDSQEVSNVSLSVPNSALNSALGVLTSQVSFPIDEASAESLAISLVSLDAALLPWNVTTAPMTLRLSSFPSSNVSARSVFVMQMHDHFVEQNSSEALRERHSYQCDSNDYSVHYFTCSNGLTAVVACNGSKELISTTCPETVQRPSCAALSATLSDPTFACYVESFTATNVTCSCPLLPYDLLRESDGTRRHLSSNNDSDSLLLYAPPAGEISLSYVGMLQAVTDTFVATVLSAQGLDGSLLKNSQAALFTIGALIVAVFISMYWSHRSDLVGRKVQMSETKDKREHAGTSWMRKGKSSRDLLQSKAVANKTNGKENLLSLAEESLPDILSSKSFVKRVTDEMKRHHRWFGVVFVYSNKFPRVLRVLSLATNIIMMLFMQSITYNLTKGDDGSCATLTTEATCLAPNSGIAPGQSKCYWTVTNSVTGQGDCAFIEPDNSLQIILFVAIFSAIVSTPIALTADWMIQSVLCAPTSTFRHRKQRAASTEKSTSKTTSNAAYSVHNPAMATKKLGIMSGSSRQVRQNRALEIGPHAGESSRRNMLVKVAALKKDKEVKVLAALDLEALKREVKAYLLSLENEQDKREFESMFHLFSVQVLECHELMLSFAVAWGLNAQGEFLQQSHTSAMNELQYRLQQLIRFTKAKNDTKQQGVAEVIRSELESLHLEFMEQKEALIQPHLSKRDQGKRLLYLFQKDLLPGVKGQILESKDRRNHAKVKAVSKSAKSLAWFVLILMNTGMLFYIFLFAVSQDSVRQRAWAQSFVMWLVVEVALVSSFVVLVMHVGIPMLVMQDVKQIQKKLVGNIKEFYKDMQVQRKLHQLPQATAADSTPVSELETFNAAKYLYVSHRVARVVPESHIAKMILHFRSPWPKQSYQHVTDVSKNYSRKFASLTRSLNLVVFYFLTNFLTIPQAIQDMVMQIVSTALLGYTVLVHLQLYYVYPVLVVVPLLVIVAIVHFVVQSMKAQEKIDKQRLLHELRGTNDDATAAVGTADEVGDKKFTGASVNALVPGAASESADGASVGSMIGRRRRGPQHIGRRQSVQQGVQLVHQLRRNLQLRDVVAEEKSGDQDLSDNETIPQRHPGAVLRRADATVGRKKQPWDELDEESGVGRRGRDEYKDADEYDDVDLEKLLALDWMDDEDYDLSEDDDSVSSNVDVVVRSRHQESKAIDGNQALVPKLSHPFFCDTDNDNGDDFVDISTIYVSDEVPVREELLYYDDDYVPGDPDIDMEGEDDPDDLNLHKRRSSDQNHDDDGDDDDDDEIGDEQVDGVEIGMEDEEEVDEEEALQVLLHTLMTSTKGNVAGSLSSQLSSNDGVATTAVPRSIFPGDPVVSMKMLQAAAAALGSSSSSSSSSSTVTSSQSSRSSSDVAAEEDQRDQHSSSASSSLSAYQETPIRFAVRPVSNMVTTLASSSVQEQSPASTIISPVVYSASSKPHTSTRQSNHEIHETEMRSDSDQRPMESETLEETEEEAVDEGNESDDDSDDADDMNNDSDDEDDDSSSATHSSSSSSSSITISEESDSQA